MNSDVGARRALRPLQRLAVNHQCAVLVLRHLNKSTRGPSIYRGGGSIGLLGVCREAVWDCSTVSVGAVVGGLFFSWASKS